METEAGNSLKHILKQIDSSQQIIADHALTISDLKTQIARLESEGLENGKKLKEMKKHIDRLESKVKTQDIPNLDNGWTVIQCRESPRYDILSESYESIVGGFGDTDGEFWIGFQKLSTLMGDHRHVLGIRLTYSDGSNTYSQYDDFKLGGVWDGFRIQSLGHYLGNDRDFLRYYNDLPLGSSTAWAWWTVPSNMCKLSHSQELANPELKARSIKSSKMYLTRAKGLKFLTLSQVNLLNNKAYNIK